MYVHSSSKKPVPLICIKDNEKPPYFDISLGLLLIITFWYVVYSNDQLQLIHTNILKSYLTYFSLSLPFNKQNK